MSTVETHREGDVMWITLNRPEVFNAFDDEMGAGFLAGLQSASDPDVRCVVITGAGKAFCAGEDLKALMEFYEAGRAPDLGQILRTRYNPMIMAIRSLKKPVVASVNGGAAGAGVALALACDHRIMAEEASFNLAFAKIGLVPDSAAIWLLDRYIGIGRTLEWAFDSGRMDSAKALQLGLVNQIVASSELGAASAKAAEAFASGPTLAFSLIKDLAWGASACDLESQLSAEAEAQAKAGSSKDHLEGVKAFLGKRHADFKGV
ncbi:MAG: enoyl-CoA hydratase-related protein [Actinomycetota bacterium]